MLASAATLDGTGGTISVGLPQGALNQGRDRSLCSPAGCPGERVCSGRRASGGFPVVCGALCCPPANRKRGFLAPFPKLDDGISGELLEESDGTLGSGAPRQTLGPDPCLDWKRCESKERKKATARAACFPRGQRREFSQRPERRTLQKGLRLGLSKGTLPNGPAQNRK